MSISNGGSCKISIYYPSSVYLDLADGSAAAPSLKFNTSAGTGLYKYNSGSIGFASNGVLAGRISSAGVIFTGSVTAVSAEFSGEVKADSLTVTNSVVAASANVAGAIEAGSVSAGTIETNNLNVATGLRAADGSSSAPSYSFSNQTNLGLYRSNGNQVSMSINATDKMIWGLNSITSQVPLYARGNLQTFLKDGNNSIILNTNNDVPRLAIALNGTESAGNLGSNLIVRRYDDSGLLIDAPMQITRSTGCVCINELELGSRTGVGNISAGTYIPTITNMVGLGDDSAAGIHIYQKIKNVVHVNGYLNLRSGNNNSSQFLMKITIPAYSQTVTNQVVGCGTAFKYPSGVHNMSSVRIYGSTDIDKVSVLVQFMTAPLAQYDTFECNYSFSYVIPA